MADTDDTRWLSYDELAAARGIKREAAKRLSFRRRWARRLSNDGVARVGVPASELVATHPRTDGDTVMTPVSDAALVDVLRAQVADLVAQRHAAALREAATRVEAEQARQEREDARVRAAAAEGEAKALREALEEARRPFWRRWLK